VVIEVPHEGGFQPVYLLNLQKQLIRGSRPVPPQALILGLDEEGCPLMVRPAAPSVAHILVAGTTGSGKSALMASMALSLALNNAPSQAKLVLIDPKGSEFRALEGLPHLLAPIIRGMEDGAVQTLAMMIRLIEEMERRDKALDSAPPIFVFIDELAELMMVGGEAFQAALTRVTQRGRGAGIHIIAGTQKPTAEVIGSLVKANFPTRIVGAVASPEDAKVASGLAGTGAEKLLGNGDFLLISRDQQIRFQAAYITAERISQVIASLTARQATPQPELPWEVEEAEKPQSVLNRLRSLLPGTAPNGQQGGHNRSDPPAMVEDAKAGMSAWALRQKYNIGGSKAQRLVDDFGPTAS
jgi:S-DNA-T family DNA segregation ATPase FtsK/SpoIIIE